MADQYIVRVTAGPGYDTAQHVPVNVNQSEPTKIANDAAEIELNVRIQDYKGLPRGSPSTSSYFSQAPHARNQDQYSISFRFTPQAPKSGAQGAEDMGISGENLQFGNDFDNPIRDRLPPGFNTALNIVRWWIDPGLDGDAYADKPYLYGPGLSSFNVLHVGKGEHDESKGGLWFDEGGDEAGKAARTEAGMPETSKARMKWALRDKAKKNWTFEYGKTYGFDFFNPYLDFSNLALKLPGFHLPLMKYWDGQGLRYVLRNKQTSEVYLVVLITIYRKEDVDEEGNIKAGAEKRAAQNFGEEKEQDGTEHHDEEAALKQAEAHLGPREQVETSADDVD